MTITKPGISWELNMGTLIHLVVLLIALGGIYQSMEGRTKLLEERFLKMDAATKRIEHYLSSKDPNYWRVVNENGDARD